MLYDYPEYYEIVFSFRDIPKEISFINKCIKEYSDIKVECILEIGCGPAPHMNDLQKYGYKYIGLDNNQNMLKYAKKKWNHLNPVPEFVNANMVSFDIPQKVDFCFVMLGSLYLSNDDQLKSHFDSISKTLKPGGLYFLDLCIQFSNPMDYNNNNAFSVEQNGIQVKSEFEIKAIDANRHLYEENWSVDINDNGKIKHLKMTEKNIALLPEEFLTFIKSHPDFEFVGWWTDWDLEKPIKNNSNIKRPFAIIRRV